MLGLFNFEVGTKITSASLIKFKARIVNNSGSPGPHPTQKSFNNFYEKRTTNLNHKITLKNI